MPPVPDYWLIDAVKHVSTEKLFVTGRNPEAERKADRANVAGLARHTDNGVHLRGPGGHSL